LSKEIYKKVGTVEDNTK